MADFVKSVGAEQSPFGIRRFLRSTKNIQENPFTLSADSVPARVLDGVSQKYLQPGTVLAKITSGPNIGKVGPFQGGGTVEVQTLTPTGTWTSGTYKLTVLGVQTAAIAIAANAATIQAAIDAALGMSGLVVVTGGPQNTTPTVYTFSGYMSQDAPAITLDNTSVVGGGTVNNVQTTQGVAGANDGRQTLANIVGLLKTAVPWTLNERDVEVAAVYRCTAVQAWCSEFNGAGQEIVLTNTTRNAMKVDGAARDLVQIIFN